MPPLTTNISESGNPHGNRHSPELQSLAIRLISSGMSPGQVCREISHQLGVNIGASTVMRWVAENPQLASDSSFVDAIMLRVKLLMALAAEHMTAAAVDLADSGDGKSALAMTTAAAIAIDKERLLDGKTDAQPRFGGAGHGNSKVIDVSPGHGILDRLNAASEAPPAPVTQGSDTPPGQES